MTTPTNLSKTFPHVDKVCDAPFLKKVTTIPTKKETVKFILENSNCYNFFNSLEAKMLENDKDIQDQITKYFTTIPEAISQFKMGLKAARATAKLKKQQADREAIKAEVRREIEMEAKAKAIQSELTPESNNESLASSSTTSTIATPKPSFTDNPSSDEPELIGQDQTIPAPETQSQPTKEMDLEDFLKYFKATVDQGLIDFQSSNGQALTVEKIDFDQQKIKVVLGSPAVVPKPSIRLR